MLDWGARLVDKEVRLKGLQWRVKGWQGQQIGGPSRVEVVERVLEESTQKMWEWVMRKWDV